MEPLLRWLPAQHIDGHQSWSSAISAPNRSKTGEKRSGKKADHVEVEEPRRHIEPQLLGLTIATRRRHQARAGWTVFRGFPGKKTKAEVVELADRRMANAPSDGLISGFPRSLPAPVDSDSAFVI